jgi:hypothetical protein
MTSKALAPVQVERKILLLRGERVMLDADLAVPYGVPTKQLVRAVKRNAVRFPADFMFQLTAEEHAGLRYQSGTSKPGRGGRRTQPYAFTEQGVAMLSGVLHSPRAVVVNVEIMRAFVRLRAMLAGNADLARKLAALEKKYDAQFRVVFDAIRELMGPTIQVEATDRVRALIHAPRSHWHAHASSPLPRWWRSSPAARGASAGEDAHAPVAGHPGHAGAFPSRMVGARRQTGKRAGVPRDARQACRRHARHVDGGRAIDAGPEEIASQSLREGETVRRAALPRLPTTALAEASVRRDSSREPPPARTGIVTARDVSRLALAMPPEILSHFGAGEGNRTPDLARMKRPL